MKKKLLLEVIKYLEADTQLLDKNTIDGQIVEVEGESLLLLIVKRQHSELFVFQSYESFITYDMPDGKWRTARLPHLLGYNYRNKYSIEEKLEKLVFEFLPNENGDALNRVCKLQDNIRKMELKKKHDRIRARIDRKMLCIKPLPKAIKKWVDKEAHKNSRYIFYKQNNGFCSVCKNEVIVKGKHHEIGKCPSCKVKIQFKAIGYSKNVIDYCMFSYLQKSDDGIVIRVFSSRKDYSVNIKNPEISYVEVRRYFPKGKDLEPYYYGNFYNVEHRWCEGFDNGGLYYKEISDRGAVYTRNLKSVLRNTENEHSGLLEYIKLQKSPIVVDEYIFAYHYNTVLEKIVKSGLKRLSKDIVFAPRRRYLQSELLWPTKVLDINKKSYNLFRLVDGTTYTLEFLKELEMRKLYITEESLRWLTNNNVLQRFSDVLEYTTIVKGINYLKKAEDSNFTLRLNLWLDYLKTAKRVKYDLNNSMRLFPRYLKKCHDEVMLLYTENKIELCNQGIIDRFAKTYEQYKFSYKGLLIKVPTCRVDIVREGEKLSHCVRSKVEGVANNKTTILFIRKKENPDKPYYTVEVKNNKIIQCYGYDHKVSTEKIKAFLQRFKNEKLYKENQL